MIDGLIGARLTYNGFLDDSVERYPFKAGEEWSRIERGLILGAVYGKPILINDGYLIANLRLTAQLADIDTSLIGNMLTSGFARVFSRGGAVLDLAAGVEARAATVNTHREIVLRPDWPIVRDNLEFLSKLLGGSVVSWPTSKNTGEILFRLLERAASAHGDAAEQIFETPTDQTIFTSALKRAAEASGRTYKGLRGNLETELWIAITGEAPEPTAPHLRKRPGYATVARLMRIANEQYHTAYALAAIVAEQEGGVDPHPLVETDAIGLATAPTFAAPELMLPDEGDLDPETEAWIAGLDDHIVQNANRLLIGLGRLRFRGRFEFISRLLLNGALRRARADYLDEFARYLIEKEGYERALQARNEFAARLADAMKGAVQPTLFERIGGVFVNLIYSALTTATALHSVPSVAGAILLEAGTTSVAERFSRRRVEIALGDDGRGAAQSARRASLLRQHLRYVGPLRDTGSAALLKDVSPFDPTA